ncbi:MAG: hypothetical protein KJT03_08120 [Verrucomicrobiae bacterium]|nr:hypothetical protein [Verrucomicrobiae bacterium]
MPATKRPISLIFFLWPATLVAAFFIGRISLTTDPTASPQLAQQATPLEQVPKSFENKKVQASADTQVPEMITEGVSDPLLQIRSAIAETDPLKRMALLTEAFSKLNKDNIMEGMALLESIDDVRTRQQMRGLLLSTWGKLDGAAAMEYVQNQEPQENRGFRGPGGGRGPGGFDRGGSILRDTMTVMSGWAEVDPKAAVAYANENGAEDSGRNMMLMAALQGWAENDVEGAINFAMNNPTEASDDRRGGRGGGMENFLINRYVNENSQAAAQWALSQSDPAKRTEAVTTVASSLANDNPQEAVLWAESISDPELRAEAIRGTASGWARQDPVAAMDWALSLEDSNSSLQASRTALSSWARQDPYNASDYVINMEAGTEKDQAAATLTRSLVREDPEMALLWAESISDPKLQVDTLAPIAQGWMQRNPEQASKWVQSSSLPEETKQALLNPKNP